MINQLKKSIDINELVEKTDYNTKINEIKFEISSIAGLVTTAVLNAAENEIPNVSNLVKKNR